MHVFLIAVSSALLLIFVWLIKDNFSTEKPLPVFSMSDKILYDKLLLIRRVSPNGNLLLKLLNEKEVFECDINGKSVAEVDEQVWLNASEKVIVCNSGQEIGEENQVGKYNTYGKYALNAAVSPDKTKISVVSGYGPRVPNISLIPFFGGGYRVLGQRYLEIKENSTTYQTLGKPFRIREMPSPSLCWTADQNLLLYYDRWSCHFSVFKLDSEPVVLTPQNQIKQMPPKPDLSRLTGVVRDYGVDEDGDGRFEKVAVEIETETSVAGKYHIFLSLKSKDGIFFTEVADVDLKGGLEMTKLLFDAKPWFDEKIDGVFKIETVDLTYQYHPFLERRENLEQTQEYKLPQFSRQNVVFTDENVVTPIDKNRNGKYENLQINIGIDILEAGDYKFQGDLYDEFSDATAEGLIEFGSGESVLEKSKGIITFNFSGKKIIEHGVSGRFRLRNVVIYKKGEKGSLMKNLLSTEPFDVKQFESEN